MEVDAASKGLGQRHCLCLAVFVGAFFQYLQRSCLGEAVVGEAGMAEEFGWTPSERGLVLSGFFYGYSLGQVPAGWAASRWGGRPLFFLLGLATLCNMLIPICAEYGAKAVFALRVVYGICQSPLWATIFALMAVWSPPTERATMLTSATISMSFAYFAGFFVTALVMDMGGWRYVFTGYGLLALLWLPLWHRFGWSSAREHPRISAEELRLIEDAQASAGSRGEVEAQSTPWLAILCSKQVWVVLLTEALGGFAGGIIFSFAPTYMHQQLGFSTREVGWFSALPQAVQLIARLLAGRLADSLVRGGVSLTHVRKLFCVIPAWTTGFFILCLCLGTPGAITSVLLITAALAAEGPLVLGSPSSVLDIAPEYAGLITGMSCMGWALVVGTSSTVVGLLLEWGRCPKGGAEVTGIDQDAASCRSAWQAAFGLAALLCFCQGLVFFLFGSSARLRLQPSALDGDPSGAGAKMEPLVVEE